YPIILSPFIGLFGVKLIWLKFLSVIFMVSSLWLFYKSFNKIVPLIVLIPSLFLVCINPHVLFFASYTYSEPLFMLTQALCFYLFFRYFLKNNPDHSLKKDWKKYLLLALVIMAMGLTRTIGFSVTGVIILYFMIERRWKNLIYTVGFFILVFGAYYLLKSIVWPDAASVQSFGTLLAKNTYNPEQGMEDLHGLIQRFIDNSNIYLSCFLYKYLGFRSSADAPLKHIPLLSIFTYVLFFIALIAVFRKNKPILFTGLYAGILLFASFILLNKIWAQDRMIMIYYPYILVFLLGGLYYIINSKSLKRLSFLYPVLIGFILIGTGGHAKNKISEHFPILQQNLLGNDLYGLTPDWENFVKMCRWANDHLDKEAVIASRKPSMSYVYTGRHFQGIYNVPAININDAIRQYEEEKDQYLFLVAEMKNVSFAYLAPFMESLFISKKEGNFFINGNKISAAFVYKINRSLYNEEELIDFLKSNQINYTFEYDAFMDQYLKDNNVQYLIINPDTLLNHIKDNRIRYLLLPKLRIYTPQNTGMYVNTIHQYINYIQLKYPDTFRVIHSIGKEETCEIAEFIGQ
ncbi:MAG: hypothetical protein LBF05_07860, partial [Tannerella sp.]|nr:hypothetical protein [Tannerella sp.]